MIDIASLTSLQANLVSLWHQQAIRNDYEGFPELVVANHEINFRLWHEEDQARDPLASDSVIANVKRAIDRLNQQRANSIEQLDEHLADQLTASRQGTSEREQLGPGTPIQSPPGSTSATKILQNTETMGSVLDRLSILALRLYHLQEQLERSELTPQLRDRLVQSLGIASQQRQNLIESAQQLVEDLFAGRKRHVTFRQLKMYNDPQLNPAIYQYATKKPLATD